jgi:hypothetical protein
VASTEGTGVFCFAGLDATLLAVGAEAPRVEPVAVGIHAIFDMVFVDCDIKCVRYIDSFVPCCALHFEQFKVARKIVMH